MGAPEQAITPKHSAQRPIPVSGCFCCTYAVRKYAVQPGRFRLQHTACMQQAVFALTQAACQAEQPA